MQFFSLHGQDTFVSKNFAFIYPVGVPQYYRAAPKEMFENDWILFFEEDEEKNFLKHHIPYGAPIHLENVEFYGYCIKMIAEEFSSQNFYAKDTMKNYFQIMMHKLEKSRRKGCPRDMCRWSFGYERSRKYGISTDRITALYRSSSKKHAEICWCKKQERIFQRFENHLSRTV